MKLKVSEIFYSAQGEGRFVGVPSIFLRTFGCNFTCAGFGCKPGERSTAADEIATVVSMYNRFEDLPLVETGCDSYASWHPDFKHLSPTMATDEVVAKMLDLLPGNNWQQKNGNYAHLVITGGEPLLGWQRAYPELLTARGMNSLADITFETNGTQELTEDFYEFIQEWHMDPNWIENNLGKWREVTFSVSPKLKVSGESWEDAIKPEIIKQYQEVGVTYLKFVVEKDSDFFEVDEAVEAYRAGGFLGSVYVMPVGGTHDTYNANRVKVADSAMERGYFYSPRLHVDLWGNGWGK